LGYPVPGRHKYGNLGVQVRGASGETVTLGPLSDCTANCRPVLSLERAPHRGKTAAFRQEIYRPSDRFLSAKLMPTLADSKCRV
jgi:hypothetical protein